MMKIIKNVWLIPLLLLQVACSDGRSSRNDSSVQPDATVPEGYTLVFSDEFDQKESGLPDPTKWYYDEGAKGWGNNELQRYIPGFLGNDTCAIVENGELKIIAKQVGDAVYSIRMNSRESWKYGYFEARLKLPRGRGTWPAFWMMPDKEYTWPLDGEIDIMEHVGYDPCKVYSTIHTEAYNHRKGTQKSGSTVVDDPFDTFHIYSVEWTAEYIRGLVDGKSHFEFVNGKNGDKSSWPFDEPFYLKLNLAWGGDWGGQEGVDPSALPATYVIDNVRVYQKKE